MKIKLLTKYDEIYNLFEEASMFMGCGFDEFCPLFNFERDGNGNLYSLMVKKDDGWSHSFYFEIDYSITFPDVDGELSDESEQKIEIIYRSADFPCDDFGADKAMKDLKSWVKDKLKELNE